MTNMLTLADYVKATGKTERTVWRWLSEGLLDGQAMKVDGAWLIPADARPARRRAEQAAAEPDEPGSAVAVAGRAVPAALAGLPEGAGLAQALATLPAFLRLDVAAFLLGIPQEQIRANAQELGAVPYGRGGSLVVPARVVRHAAGL